MSQDPQTVTSRVNPPELSPSPGYAQVAEIHAGRIILSPAGPRPVRKAMWSETISMPSRRIRFSATSAQP